MSSSEILARIAYDLSQLTTPHESRRVVIGLTVDEQDLQIAAELSKHTITCTIDARGGKR